MKAVRKFIDKLLEVILVLVMTVLVAVVFWQVVARYLLSGTGAWTEELSRFLLIWLALLGAAYGTGQGVHLAIDLFPNLSTFKKRWRNLIINACILLFAVFGMIGGGLRLVIDVLTLDQLAASLQIPIGYIYIAAPAAGFCMALYALDDLINTWRNVTTDEPDLEEKP
jgi:TRAP-type C4-dicarboxylate transport system permease small subunit